MEEETTIQSMDIVFNALKEASKFGLETEVVVWALESMRSNPNQSVGTAMMNGFDEWVK